MTEYRSIINITPGEADAAIAAIETYRNEQAALASAAERRGTPTWKNTLYSKHARHGYESIQSYANSLGYTFYEWNGWVYPTELGLFATANQVCEASELDKVWPPR